MFLPEHEDYMRYAFCLRQEYKPTVALKEFEPMTNLEYLEYQYEKTQAI
jgi:hypothetical protein